MRQPINWGMLQGIPRYRKKKRRRNSAYIPGWILCEVEALSLGSGSLEEEHGFRNPNQTMGNSAGPCLPYVWLPPDPGKLLALSHTQEGPMCSVTISTIVSSWNQRPLGFLGCVSGDP